MADDKNIKAPDIPAADTGPGTGQPPGFQSRTGETRSQRPHHYQMPDKKLEPEAASPNVSVYNYSEIMKGKKARGTGRLVFPGKSPARHR